MASASLFAWEGIVNDLVGVLLAVSTLQFFTVGGEGVADALTGLAAAVVAAAVLGGAGGWLTGAAFRRGAVPEHLEAPVLMVLGLVVYWASKMVQHEAGLLSVTVMGVVLGNMPLVERESLRPFKENLAVVLLSVLFLVIPAQLSLDDLALIDLRAAAFVLAVLFLVRPLAIGVALLGAPVRTQDYETLRGRLDEGWTVQTTELTDAYGIDDLEERLAAAAAWAFIGGVAPRRRVAPALGGAADRARVRLARPRVRPADQSLSSVRSRIASPSAVIGRCSPGAMRIQLPGPATTSAPSSTNRTSPARTWRMNDLLATWSASS